MQEIKTAEDIRAELLRRVEELRSSGQTGTTRNLVSAVLMRSHRYYDEAQRAMVLDWLLAGQPEEVTK